jgi:DNA-binding GntR family transcriptional regulator
MHYPAARSRFDPASIHSTRLSMSTSTSSSSRSGSTATWLAQAIGKRILQRKFEVGQRLVEADLMREFGVGRSTVREALKSLASGGIVELNHHRGATVRMLSPEDAHELLQVIEMLAALAARLAAANIAQQNNRQRFEAAAQALTGADLGGDLERILDQRGRYYQVMFDIAANKELNQALPLQRIHLFRSQFHGLMSRSDVKAMVAEYRGISAAILAGDQGAAESRMRRHIRKTAERTLARDL